MNLKAILDLVQPKETPVIQIIQHLKPEAFIELLKYATKDDNGVYVFPEDLTVSKLSEKLSKL